MACFSIYVVNLITYLIRDVALSSGFSNAYYCSKVFRRKFGLSPCTYAKINACGSEPDQAIP